MLRQGSTERFVRGAVHGWSGERNAGFSGAPPSKLPRPVPDGEYGPDVSDQELGIAMLGGTAEKAA